MIELTKSGKQAFDLKMDANGVKRMMRYLETIRDTPSIVISNNGKDKDFFIIEMDEAENLTITNQEIKLELDEEEVEFFYLRLGELLEKGVFYPAEFCNPQFKGRETYIYVVFCKKASYIEEKKVKIKKGQQRGIVQFKSLNYAKAKGYCEYKYARKKRERNETLLALEISWVMSAFVATLIKSQMKWIIVGGAILLFLITPIFLFRTFVKKNGGLESAAEYGMEYAVTKLDICKEKKFVYSDGQEEICKMEFDDEVKAKNGTLVVIVRAKATGKMFTETMETWDDIPVSGEYGDSKVALSIK